MSKDDVVIVGYPKSGNTWLARLMGDALQRPIRGIDGATPIAATEDNRDDSGGIVQQLHLRPDAMIDAAKYPGFVATPWKVNPQQHNGEIVIHIIRDPRDVAVSINAYWGIGDLTRTIDEVMSIGSHPLWGCGWGEYIEAWRSSDVQHLETRYEWLHADTEREVMRLLHLGGLKAERDLIGVVNRQSFDMVRADINEHGDQMAYGSGIQATNLRKGIVGDWRSKFTFEQAYLAAQKFNPWFIKLGYEESEDWYLSFNVPGRFQVLIVEWYTAGFDDPLNNPRMAKSLGLYQLAALAPTSGEIIELGTWHANGAISLASGAQRTIYTIDDYAARKDWMSNVSTEQDAARAHKHIDDSGLPIIHINAAVENAAQTWSKPLALVFWDTGDDTLLLDFEMWHKHLVSGGMFVVHDTPDGYFGSEKLWDVAQALGYRRGPCLPFLNTVIKP